MVVLGCQVSANGEPTVMLRDRIDAACDYLSAHPESRCVASGGQNNNEPISEAACIRDTLAARGIDPTASWWRTGPVHGGESALHGGDHPAAGLNPGYLLRRTPAAGLGMAGRCGLEAVPGFRQASAPGPHREAVAVVGIRTAVDKDGRGDD